MYELTPYGEFEINPAMAIMEPEDVSKAIKLNYSLGIHFYGFPPKNNPVVAVRDGGRFRLFYAEDHLLEFVGDEGEEFPLPKVDNFVLVESSPVLESQLEDALRDLWGGGVASVRVVNKKPNDFDLDLKIVYGNLVSSLAVLEREGNRILRGMNVAFGGLVEHIPLYESLPKERSRTHFICR
jgi:hypothetical protein